MAIGHLTFSGYKLNNEEYNLATMHKKVIGEALRRHNGKSREFIGEQLGVSDKTLRNMIKHYGIQVPVKKRKAESMRRHEASKYFRDNQTH